MHTHTHTLSHTYTQVNVYIMNDHLDYLVLEEGSQENLAGSPTDGDNVFESLPPRQMSMPVKLPNGSKGQLRKAVEFDDSGLRMLYFF